MTKLNYLALITSAAVSLTTPREAKAENDPIMVPTAESGFWKPIKKTGVELKTQDGMVSIQYDLDIQKSRRIQHRTLFEDSIFLEFTNPVPVPEGMERILFAARGQDGSAEARKGTVFLRPVLEDASGERFSYEPYPTLRLIEGTEKDWALWTTRPFPTSEAGGASPNIYVASGGDENTRPDGELRFVGFELRVRTTGSGNSPGPKKGMVYLGDVQLAPLRQKEKAPGFYADALFQEKGRYRLGFEVRESFQETPVSELAQEIDFDPADEKSRSTWLEIPSAKDLANSWVRYQATDNEGKIVAEGESRWETDKPLEPKEKDITIDVTKRPAIGYTRINPTKFTSGVYPESAPLELVIRVFRAKEGAPQPTSLKWGLKTYAFEEKVAEGKEDILFGKADYVDVSLPLDATDGLTAFKFDYQIQSRDGEVLDKGRYLLGRAGKISATESRSGVLPNRESIKSAAYNRITFHDGNAKLKTAEEHVTRFVEILQQAGDMTNHVTYMIDLANFEILPGVYDFSLLDQIMDKASDYRFGVTVRLAHAESKAPYLWLPYAKVRDFDGEVIGGHPYYKAVSMADGSYMDSWAKAFQALHDRYRKHPAFEGYYIMLPNGEWVIPEEVWHGKIADYSHGAQTAFRDYLQKDLKLDLAALNARWGKNFSSWEEVIIPLPLWSIGTAPDLRPEWRDFCRFKLMLNNHWCVELGERIRGFDQDRVIISYGTPLTVIGKDGERPIDYAHNGGNHFLVDEGRFVKAWDDGKGVGWITEPHSPHRWADYGDPAEEGWVLDWSVFVTLSQAGGGGANLHVYYYPNPTYDLIEHFGGVYSYDRFEQFKPILSELYGLQIVAPKKEVAAFSDSETLFAKHRTTFAGRINDLRRWFELLTADAVPWEMYTPDNRGNYKVVFLNPLDEVLAASSIEELDQAVRAGATVVMTAGTGRFNSDDPAAEYALLKKFGIPTPKGSWQTDGESVSAVVEPGFRQELGRDSIPFYSQKDMKRELQDPKIGADFHRWPYRWLPQSDYFGYFKGNTTDSGEVIARFPDGGVAMSRHKAGKGAVVVFWGTPDMTPARLQGLLGKLVENAGVTTPQAGNAIPYMLEGKHRDLPRHYALLFQQTPGTYQQKLPNAPDGDWFIDDMVSSQRLGTFNGKELREKGLSVTYLPGMSPLKVLRIYQPAEAKWQAKYPGGNSQTSAQK